MQFTTWLLQVEALLGYDLDASFTIHALRCFREGWTVDEYATEVIYSE